MVDIGTRAAPLLLALLWAFSLDATSTRGHKYWPLATHSEDGIVYTGYDPYADLVIATNQNTAELNGCGAISVLSLIDRKPTFLGENRASPGRLAVSPDLSLLIAVFANYGYGPDGPGGPGYIGEPFLYVTEGSPDELDWTTQAPITGRELATNGGIAFTLDGDGLLLTEASARSGGFMGPEEFEPFWIRRYDVDSVRSGFFGSVIAETELDSLVVEILPDLDGHRVHTFQSTGEVRTLDVDTLEEVAEPVSAQRLVHGSGDPRRGIRGGVAHAALTLDGRYMVTNRWESPILNVIDLIERRAWGVELDDVDIIGGVALSHGPENQDLLAVHAIDEVVVLRFAPTEALEELARISIAPPPLPFNHMSAYMGPVASVAWSGNGSKIIAATSHGSSELVIVDVPADRSAVATEAYLESCAESRSTAPGDVFTINSLIRPPPSPTSTPQPLPSAKATPTARHTSTSTSTPSTKPAALYLPVLLSERFDPTTSRADFVFVIDASTIMLGPPSAGRSKLEAAKETALAFIRQLGDEDELDSASGGALAARGHSDCVHKLVRTIGMVT